MLKISQNFERLLLDYLIFWKGDSHLITFNPGGKRDK